MPHEDLLHLRPLLSDSVTVLRKHSREIATELFKHLFRLDPSVKSLFGVDFLESGSGCPFDTSQDNISVQAKIISDAIVEFSMIVTHSDGDDDSFDALIDRVCTKHVCRNVNAAHYDCMAKSFSLALGGVLSGILSDEQLSGWNTALRKLIRILRKREDGMAKMAKKSRGGWVGFRSFIVHHGVPKLEDPSNLESAEGVKVKRTSRSVTNDGRTVIRLTPEDHANIPMTQSGQYVCMRFNSRSNGPIYINLPLNTCMNPSVRFDSISDHVEDGQVGNCGDGKDGEEGSKLRAMSFSRSYEVCLPTLKSGTCALSQAVGRENIASGGRDEFPDGTKCSSAILHEELLNDSVVELSTPVGSQNFQNRRRRASSKRRELDTIVEK